MEYLESKKQKIISNKNVELENLVEKVKMHAWKWMKVKATKLKLNITWWCLNPRATPGFTNE